MSPAHAPPADLSVIMVTWNGWDLTRRALASLYATAPAGLRLEVVVVDNDSTDATRPALAAEFPQVRLVRLDRNYGFATANNRAIPHATAPLLFLLNNDTVVEPGALAALVDAARAHPAFDVFASQMVQLADPGRVDNRGIYLDATAHCRQLDTDAPVEPGRPACEIFGASAGACVLRRRVVDELQLFDESLESYWEDCDFAYRVRAAGHRCLYVPGARIRHVGSATGNRIADRKLYLIQRNMPLVTARWLRFPPLRAYSWLFAARELYYVARAPLAGRGGLVLRAKRDAWRRTAREGRRSTGDAALRRWIGRKARPLDPARAAGGEAPAAADTRA